MDASSSVEMLGLFALVLALGGLAAGFIAGLFGIGGGGVMVPILYEAFGWIGVDPAVRMHLSVGTALAVMIPTTTSSFRTHLKRGNVDQSFISRMIVPVVFGVVVGSIIAKFSSAEALKWVWVIVAGVIAARQFAGSDFYQLGTEIPKSKLLEAWGVVIGVISTLMSVGGGAFVITTLALYGRSMQQAVGTSSGFGPMIALPGMLGFVWAGWGIAGLPPVSIGYVSVIGALCMIPTGVLAAPIGARVASGVSKRALEIGYGAFMIVIASRFAYSLWG
ncbi:MAG: sulfite exporter TauE/SafE family protein [Pseudomonadota bacterium]